MLKLPRRAWGAAAGIAGLFALYFVAVHFGAVPYAQVCAKGERGLPDQCSYYDVVSAMVGRGLVFVDDHNGAFAAIAGVAVAAFTGVLWVATDRLWKSSERQHAASNRAFVFLDGFSVDLTRLSDARNTEGLPSTATDRIKFPDLFVTRFSFRPRLTNSGTTPSKNLRVSIQWQEFGPIGIADFDYGFSKGPEPMFLGPRATEVGIESVIPAGTINSIIGGGFPTAGHGRIFVWGRVDYDDIFGGPPHYTQWCYEVVFAAPKGHDLSATFVQWGPYNQSDEDGRPYNFATLLAS